MSRHRSKAAAGVVRDTLQLSIAAPQVVAHRVGRMLRAGPAPSAADQREFQRMGAEKVLAFWQSWAAMTASAWQLQWQMGLSLAPHWGQPQAMRRAMTRAASPDAALQVLAAGLRPVHGKAVANARRLGKRGARSRR